MLNYAGLALIVALAWFFAANLVASLVLLASAPLVRRSIARLDGALLPFACRLLPATLSLAVACGFVIPAYLWLEPAQAQERVGWAIRLFAAGGGMLAAASLARGARTVWRNSRALRATVASRSSLPPRAESTLPAFAVHTAAPLLILAGVFRSRLYISDLVLRALTPHELSVAIAHEMAHHRARDNCKRALMAFAPDVLAFSSLGRWLEREWHLAAERNADAAASRGGQADALALAGALVKVARLNAGRPRLDFGCAAFDDGAPVARRVQRLVGGPTVRATTSPVAVVTAAAAAILMLGALAWMPEALILTHRITEFAVRLP